MTTSSSGSPGGGGASVGSGASGGSGASDGGVDSGAAGEGAAELGRARAELRRLGYLDHGLERFLLQDALRPRQPLRTLALLTLKVGVLGGGLLAAALAVALAMANGSVAAAPLDLPVLFLHLFPPVSITSALAFLALGSAVLLVLRLYPVRRIEAVALATALVAGAAALALAFWEARPTVAESGAVQRAALALGAAAATYALVRLVYQGLLALAIRFTQRAPAEGLVAWRWRRWVSGALAAGALLLAVPVVLAARDTGTPPAPLLPMAPGERVLVLGLDGVLPDEVEYLLRRGDLPAMAALQGRGGRLLRYPRPDEPPAALWTTLATGLAPPEHGVAALDSFLPLGVRTPLARSGFLRSYWSRVEVPLHLAAYRPVLSNRRSAFTLWELASRGGAPVLAVNWWATFPAPRVAGLVLSHDAYQLLRQGATGAVSAPDATADLLRQARDVAAAPMPDLPAAGATGGARDLAGAAGGLSAEAVRGSGAEAVGGRGGGGEGRGRIDPGNHGGSEASGGIRKGTPPSGAAPARGATTGGRGTEAAAERGKGAAAERGAHGVRGSGEGARDHVVGGGFAVRQGARDRGDDGLAVLNAGLPAREAAAVAERAVRPDWFYRRVFASRLGAPGAEFGAAALYLPGLDIAATGWQGSDVAFGDLVRQELRAADRLLAQALAEPGWGSVVVVFDPGRRRAPAAGGAAGAAAPPADPASDPTRRSRPLQLSAGLGVVPAGARNSGRVLLWQRRGCSPEPAATTLESIAAGLLRTLGLPQSAELPPPPAQCRWPDPPAIVATYGHPPPIPAAGVAGAAGAAAEGTEYLQNLRSLGYL